MGILPPSVQAKGRGVSQRERHLFIRLDQEAAIPGICEHFDSGRGGGIIRVTHETCPY
jgi:hypothetical protein